MARHRAEKLTMTASPYAFYDVLRRKSAFQTRGSLTGRPGEPDNWTRGELPPRYHRSLQRADYVVYSGSTPIVWHDTKDSAWVVPETIYDRTATTHQNKIKTALYIGRVAMHHPE